MQSLDLPVSKARASSEAASSAGATDPRDGGRRPSVVLRVRRRLVGGGSILRFQMGKHRGLAEGNLCRARARRFQGRSHVLLDHDAAGNLRRTLLGAGRGQFQAPVPCRRAYAERARARFIHVGVQTDPVRDPLFSPPAPPMVLPAGLVGGFMVVFTRVW